LAIILLIETVIKHINLGLIRGAVTGVGGVGCIDDQVLHRWERNSIHDDLTAARSRTKASFMERKLLTRGTYRGI